MSVGVNSKGVCTISLLFDAKVLNYIYALVSVKIVFYFLSDFRNHRMKKDISTLS